MPLAEAPATGRLPFPVPASFPDDLAPFWRLWAEERFWACHEALEDVWRSASGPRRLYLNGLIHLAVSVFQHRRGNPAGAARQLVRARVKLEEFLPEYEGLVTGAFLRAVEAEVAPSLAALSPHQISDLAALERLVREQVELGRRG